MDKTSFKEKLDQAHSYPTLYMFKFIVPQAKVKEVEDLFPKNELAIKPSSKGNYVSTTAKVMVSSSEQIMEIYERAQKIEGIIAL